MKGIATSPQCMFLPISLGQKWWLTQLGIEISTKQCDETTCNPKGLVFFIFQGIGAMGLFGIWCSQCDPYSSIMFSPSSY
jgi:hypothetical protein